MISLSEFKQLTINESVDCLKSTLEQYLQLEKQMKNTEVPKDRMKIKIQLRDIENFIEGVKKQ